MISVGVAILALKILNVKNDRKSEKIKKIQDLCHDYNANDAIKVSSKFIVLRNFQWSPFDHKKEVQCSEVYKEPCQIVMKEVKKPQ